MPRLLTSDDVAEMLQWTSEHVRRLARAGRMPAFKLGREWRFSEATVMEWVASGQPSPSEQPTLFDQETVSPEDSKQNDYMK